MGLLPSAFARCSIMERQDALYRTFSSPIVRWSATLTLRFLSETWLRA